MSGGVDVYIVRHGNTFDPGDVVTRVGGRTDLDLSASGRQQADVLAEHFKVGDVVFDLAYCSPLKRTRQTAQAILSSQRIKAVQTEPFLTEIDYGPDENRPEAEVVSRIGEDALADWEAKATPPPGWLVDPEKLTADWLEFFARFDEPSGKADTVLVVTSNGIARFALSALGFEKNVASIKLSTGAYGHFCLRGNRADMLAWNVKPPPSG